MTLTSNAQFVVGDQLNRAVNQDPGTIDECVEAMRPELRDDCLRGSSHAVGALEVDLAHHAVAPNRTRASGGCEDSPPVAKKPINDPHADTARRACNND
jgi:hypothetical protein